jgi:hypothetical protein
MLQAEGLNSGASARAVRLRALSCCSSSFSPTKHGMAEAMNTLIGGPETLYRKTPHRLDIPIQTLVASAISIPFRFLFHARRSRLAGTFEQVSNYELADSRSFSACGAL